MVCVVIDHETDGGEIRGVFATRAAAEHAKVMRGHYRGLYGPERLAAVGWAHASIEEWDIES